MKLVYSKQKTRIVQVGDEVQNNDADHYVISGIETPHKPSSTGRVYVRKVGDESNVPANEMSFFPGVFGMEWIEREDHKVKPKAVRMHNEWFRTASLGGRKSCPECKSKIEPGEKIWSWGEYAYAKWRTVMHFCKSCFTDKVKAPLSEHVEDCGCVVNFVGYGGEELPKWLTLE